MTAGEIADQFSVLKPSISHHLNTLKQAGIVDDERCERGPGYNCTFVDEEKELRVRGLKKKLLLVIRP